MGVFRMGVLPKDASVLFDDDAPDDTRGVGAANTTPPMSGVGASSCARARHNADHPGRNLGLSRVISGDLG